MLDSFIDPEDERRIHRLYALYCHFFAHGEPEELRVDISWTALGDLDGDFACPQRADETQCENGFSRV